MGKLTISMAMFNSYVSLPEGTLIKLYCTSIKLPSSTVLYQTFLQQTVISVKVLPINFPCIKVTSHLYRHPRSHHIHISHLTSHILSPLPKSMDWQGKYLHRKPSIFPSNRGFPVSMFIDNNSIHQYGAYLICIHQYGVHTRWCPPVISWFIIPLTIDISPINHSYWSYKPTQLSNGGTTLQYTISINQSIDKATTGRGGRGEIRDLPGFHIPTLRPSLAVHRAPHLLHVWKISWFLMGARFFTGQPRVGLEKFFLIKHVVFLQLIQMSQHIPIHIYTCLYHGIFSRYKYRYLQV